MRAVAGEILLDEALLIRRYGPGDEEAAQALRESALRAASAYAEGHGEELAR